MNSSLRRFLVRPAFERGLFGFVLYRIRWAINGLIALFFVATAGYVVLEHYSILDAAFMTVITLSTVGYEVLHPLDAIGKIFTIGVIVASFAMLAYAGATVTSLFTSGEIAEHIRKSKVTRMRHGTESHIIVVGFGRVGQAAAHGVAQFGRQCVVIDRNPDRTQAILDAGYVPMIGDATAEADLQEAGIDRAVALIAAAEEDSVNLIVTLTARALRPELQIVSRVNELTWQERIIRAGASVAQSPYRAYGLSLAASAVNPAVLEMHEISSLGLVTEEIEVSPTSALVGRPLRALGLSAEGVLVLGLRRDRQFQRWNDVAGVIEPRDVLVALGAADAIGALVAMA